MAVRNIQSISQYFESAHGQLTSFIRHIAIKDISFHYILWPQMWLMEVNMKQVEIYTDGACSGNPGAGGWGAVLIYGEHKIEMSGYEESTTNNKMELTAALEALKRLKEPCSVNLYSDSAYLINAFTQGWIDKWIKTGWKRNKNEEVKNIELWKELIRLSDYHKINWIKVKGHADNEMNNRCDKLATDEIKKAAVRQ
jgi:ribonuclease HI